MQRRASNTCVPGSDPVEMVAPGTRVPGCPTRLEQTLPLVLVLISGSMFIGLDLSSTDRVKRLNWVFISGRWIYFFHSVNSTSTVVGTYLRTFTV